MRNKIKSGRPALFADVKKIQTRRQVYLDDETVDFYRKNGIGNLSAGIRKAAAVLREMRKIK